MWMGEDVFFGAPFLNREIEVKFDVFGGVEAIEYHEFGGTDAIGQPRVKGNVQVFKALVWFKPDNQIRLSLVQTIVMRVSGFSE